MRRIVRLGAGVLLAACGVLMTSCGGYVREERLPETGATLEGTVTYGTEKVPAALVIVAGAGGSATGHVDEATGRYKVENAPLGEVKLAVNTAPVRGEMQGKLMSGYYKGPEAKGKGVTAPPKIVDVPAKFANPATSGLSTTINAGANTYEIKLPR
ncbi:hypothetical protein R5W24_004873 [Gemmata sp. JC717]|uniref:hypothetical protein n=1 Tax=Gemmata algarum TaxID=2975278 RepID=UPI0021BA4C73|nr:hypothetical protein [Gemmata algarum]MDY3555728.1 hypothetical protein [Gemmata algarum]